MILIREDYRFDLPSLREGASATGRGGVNRELELGEVFLPALDGGVASPQAETGVGGNPSGCLAVASQLLMRGLPTPLRLGSNPQGSPLPSRKGKKGWN